ncbi:hypothetical protein KUTeg_010901 [Tegillarca granosa]|uniref:Uncharacterized protein n=1 Tax=Tegillarca granosa TaxID=220873 RepID=A0ABQ9F5R5_TEGGR|nr:hypothetical protein KUTeg_010901 [Tegillarca granosa]
MAEWISENVAQNLLFIIDRRLMPRKEMLLNKEFSRYFKALTEYKVMVLTEPCLNRMVGSSWK